MELQLKFRTDKFNLSGPLPDHINAGNQFYGEDVAKFLCESLPRWNLTYLDEDWGWLVCTRKDSLPYNERHMLCVYGYPPDSPNASDSGSWMVSILTEQKAKWLGFLTRWKRAHYNPTLASDVIAALETLGVNDLERTEA